MFKENDEMSNVMVVGDFFETLRNRLRITSTVHLVDSIADIDSYLESVALIDTILMLPAIVSATDIPTLEQIQQRHLIPCIALIENEQLIAPCIESNIFACLAINGLSPDRLRQWINQARLVKLQQSRLTQLEQLQAELQEKNRLINEIFMALTDSVNIFDVINSVQLFGNHRVAETLGYTTQEIDAMGANLVDQLIHPDDLERYHIYQRQLVTSTANKADQLQLRLKGKDGDWHWVESDYSVFRRNEDDAVVEILGVARDITRYKQVEDNLQHALDLEVKLREQKTQFIQVTSHEFRTPLTIIQSSAETLYRYYDRLNAEKRQEKMGLIYQQIQHMTKMIDDMSFIVTMDSGNQPQLQKTDVNILKFVQTTISNFELANNISGRIRLDAPAIDQIIAIEITLLQYIIGNLLSNGYKYTLDESPIDIHVRCDERQLIIRVQDYGIGIPENDLPHIFTSFYRGHNIGQIQGTGLGMYIVSQAIERYGGTIHIESTIDVGTTVTVSLPI